MVAVSGSGSVPGSGAEPDDRGAGASSTKSLALWSLSAPVAARCAEVEAVRSTPVGAVS
jgi:hypothetical protein